MINISNTSNVALQPTEYCYIAEYPQRYDSASFKVIVPRLMPNVSGGKVSFNRNILVNDKACKPSIASSISTQKYLTIIRSPQCNLKPAATITEPGETEPTLLAVGTRLQMLSINNNYKELKIIDYK